MTDIQTNGVVTPDKGRLRKTIRKKVVELLKRQDDDGNYPTDALARVYPNAAIPPWEEELPVILVYQQNETASMFSEAPRELERSFNIILEISAAGPEENADMETPALDDDGNPQKTVEDILDDIAEQIECVLDPDDSLEDVCDESVLTATEFEFAAEGGKTIGSCRLTYQITYYTMTPRSVTKQGDLPDFSKAHLDWNLDNDENAPEAIDEVDIPTT